MEDAKQEPVGDGPANAAPAVPPPQQAPNLRDRPTIRPDAAEAAPPDRRPSPACGETPTLAPNRSGERVGDYELLEQIAQGGMAVVYKARHLKLNRDVALKMIKAGQLADAEDVKRFRREAEAAAQLDHPNIVHVYEAGEHRGQQFFTMALVDGESLAQRVARGPLPPAEAVGLLRAVAEAVAHAHAQGVVHRDLKPNNILLGRDGRPRVTDFGIAKRLGEASRLTVSGQILGTPAYMAPEQAGGKPDAVGPAADVYALGAVLYTLLVGIPPFQAAGPVQTLRQVLNETPVSPRMLNPSVPRELEAVCLRCLRKEPGERYPGARELAEELRRFAEAGPTPAPKPGREASFACPRCGRRLRVADDAAGKVVRCPQCGNTIQAPAPQAAPAPKRPARPVPAAAPERPDVSVAAFNYLKGPGKATAPPGPAEPDERVRRLEAALAKAEAALYARCVALAERAVQDRDWAQAARFLNDCPAGLRHWEWHYLSRRVRQARPRAEQGSVPPAWALTLGPAGGRLAWAKGATVTVREALTGVEVRRFPVQNGPVTAVSLSPDGQQLACGVAGAPGEVLLWETETGVAEPFLLRDRRGVVTCLAFSPDGTRLALGAAGLGDSAPGSRPPGGVTVWDVVDGREVFPLPALDFPVRCVHFGPFSRRLAVAGGEENQPGVVTVWDAVTKEEILAVRDHPGAVHQAVFSQDGAWLAASGQDAAVRLWEVGTDREPRVLRGHPSGRRRGVQPGRPAAGVRRPRRDGADLGPRGRPNPSHPPRRRKPGGWPGVQPRRPSTDRGPRRPRGKRLGSGAVTAFSGRPVGTGVSADLQPASRGKLAGKSDGVGKPGFSAALPAAKPQFPNTVAFPASINVARQRRSAVAGPFVPDVLGDAEKDWAQQDSNLQPRDYESPALTVELWALNHCPLLFCGVLFAGRLPHLVTNG